jgi:hypothetical protein
MTCLGMATASIDELRTILVTGVKAVGATGIEGATAWNPDQ